MRKTLVLITVLALLVASGTMPVLAAYDLASTISKSLVAIGHNQGDERLRERNNTRYPPRSSATPTPTPPCVAGTFTLTGNSGQNGSDGNIRTFVTPSGVKLHASAFSVK